MPAALSCACGAVTGSVSDRSLGAGLRLVCHCRDCRAFQVAVGRDDPGAAEGVDLIQLPPAGLELNGEIAALRLSPRGPFRFYAPCCGAPIATTMTSRTVPFAGVLSSFFTDQTALPPVRAYVNMRAGDGSAKHKGMGRVVRALLGNAMGACLRGERTKTPFFDEATGAPVVTPVVIEKGRKTEIYSAL